MRIFRCFLGLVLFLGTSLRAQGTLSGQGFGYPLGGLSARALALGGAVGEFDPRSARNPAAVTQGLRMGLYAQYDPEYRQVKSATLTDNTVVPRFAAFGLIFPVKQTMAVGLSTHGLLDRTWATRIRSGQRLGPDSVLFTETNRSSGAINETRLTFGWQHESGKVSLGLAAHFLTGENRLNLRREFDDSLRYGTLNRSLTLAYSGRGVSGGIIVQPVSWLSVAASARQGGGIDLRVEDTVKTSASVPNRFGAAVRMDAIPGVSLMASADRASWSRLNGLGSSQAAARDAWEYGAGIEFFSTRARRITDWTYSLGYRSRELPFAAAGSGVDERLLSGGLAVPVARGRVSMDMAALRVTREATGQVAERAWQFSFGVTVRP
jgi:hypothetical protein